jgi:type IV pilus assembly protein PilY1
MNAAKRFKNLAALALAVASVTVQAEDIDIYQGIEGGGRPNLLIILDNSAAADASLGAAYRGCTTAPTLVINDPTKNFGFMQCGLYSAIDKLGQNKELKGKLDLGLMYFPVAGTDGGTFILPKPSPVPSALPTMDDSGLAQMLTRVSQLNLKADKTNNNQISQAMQEAWAFYLGKRGLSGTQYPGVDSTTSCSHNFVLYITLATNNQKPQDGGSLAAGALATAMNLSTVPQIVPPEYAPWKTPLPGGSTAGNKYQGDPADEWAKFMYTGKSTGSTTTNPSITTYTIILTDKSNPDYEQHMVSMATQGGGKYSLVELGDVSGIVDAISDVFNEVQATNSVFAAPVLPVSTNAQGTYLNQIYIGMFRPDKEGDPRWMGNLKQYQFGVDTTNPISPEIFLADSTGKRALSAAGTGFLSPDAISFWSSESGSSLPDSKGGFWVDATTEQGGMNGLDSPDGQIVEKGGVGQQIRLRHLTDTYPASSSVTGATSSRYVYTCPLTGCTTGSALSATPFSAKNTALDATGTRHPERVGHHRRQPDQLGARRGHVPQGRRLRGGPRDQHAAGHRHHGPRVGAWRRPALAPGRHQLRRQHRRGRVLRFQRRSVPRRQRQPAQQPVGHVEAAGWLYGVLGLLDHLDECAEPAGDDTPGR